MIFKETKVRGWYDVKEGGSTNQDEKEVSQHLLSTILDNNS